MQTIEINEATFETEVLKSTQPVLVELGTEWSLPSMVLDGALNPNDDLVEGVEVHTTSAEKSKRDTGAAASTASR